MFAGLVAVAGTESADFLEVFYLALCLVSVAADFKAKHCPPQATHPLDVAGVQMDTCISGFAAIPEGDFLSTWPRRPFFPAAT